jgi:hypothetical protein
MTFKVNDTQFQDLLRDLGKMPEVVMKEAHTYYRRETPIRSGNARSKTSRKNLTIKSAYPYAARLDEGWSKQSPQGMTDPTSDKMDEYVSNYVKKVS